jgi:hypothetical protein
VTLKYGTPEYGTLDLSKVKDSFSFNQPISSIDITVSGLPDGGKFVFICIDE